MSDPEGISYRFQRFQNCGERYLTVVFPFSTFGALWVSCPSDIRLSVTMSVRMSAKTDVWRTDGVREQET